MTTIKVKNIGKHDIICKENKFIPVKKNSITEVDFKVGTFLLKTFPKIIVEYIEEPKEEIETEDKMIKTEKLRKK